MNERLDPHLLTGAYASGALTLEEQEAFTEHLATCADCRLEARELVETAAVLGVAAAEEAPPALREKVFAEIGRTRQLPPVVVALPPRQARRARGRRRLALGAAACLAVVSLGLGGYVISLSEENSDLRAWTEQIAAVQAAPDARTVTDSWGAATTSVTHSASHDAIVFVCNGLEALDSGRTYQLWLLDEQGTARPAGTFDHDGKHATTQLVRAAGQAKTLAVTEEPSGGSPAPTSEPILAISL